MDGEKLNKEGLKKVWLKFWSLLKVIVGDVDVEGKGDLQTQVNSIEKNLPGVVSKTKNGLVPQLPDESTTTKYLRQDGTWTTPPDTNTTYGAATQFTNGLMTAVDKKKLDEIDEDANAYTHPQTHSASMIEQDVEHRFVSDIEKNAWNNKLNKADVTQSPAVTISGQKALDAVEKNASVPGTMAYDLAQINSNITPTHQTGLTSANSNIELYKVSFFTVSKLCVISFEVIIKGTFSTGEIIRLPAGYRAYGTYHFVCDLANGICKHAWISDNQDVIYIQNGAEKTGNLRGEVVFMLR